MADTIPWQEIEMLKGSQGKMTLLKFGRKGEPHFRDFCLSEDMAKLTWYSKKKKGKDSEGASSCGVCPCPRLYGAVRGLLLVKHAWRACHHR